MNALRTTKEKLPRLLMHLVVTPANTFNFDETALHISILARKTYGSVRTAGRKIAKQRLTVGFLVNDDGTRVFKPLVISKSKRPHDFRPDYNPEEYCYWHHNAKGWMTSNLLKHFIKQLDTAMYVEGKKIVVLLDNASNRTLKTEGATREDMFGFCTVALGNVRLEYLPPNTTYFTQPLDQGLISMAKARYRQHWLRAFTGMWTADGATSAVARFKPNMRAVVEWLNDAWMNLPPRAIQRCWWHTGCLPRVWALSLPHVETGPRNNGGTVVDGADGTEIGLDEEVNDVGLLIDWLCLGPSAMAAEAFVGIDDNQPTCAEPSEDPLAREPLPRDAATPRRRGRVLPAWMHVPTLDWVAQTARRQELIEAGAPAVMSGYLVAAEWMRV
ncbi:unnamed protein product [Closterium sp. NIES-64]|nr:unnamed protein product [Closterium sp. NIES-64]